MYRIHKPYLRCKLLTFKTLAKLYDVPAFAIDVPMQQNEDNVKYVADQIRDLKVFLEKCTGKTITEDGLKERMRRSKRTMDKFIECQKKSADKDIKTDLVTPLFAGMTNNIVGNKRRREICGSVIKRYRKSTKEKRKEYLLDAHDPILVRCSTGSTGI
mgnify:CR=1 FL=1